jgi:hypothetical protein
MSKTRCPACHREPETAEQTNLIDKTREMFIGQSAAIHSVELQYQDLCRDIILLQEKLDELKKYVDHTPACESHYNNPCDCGLEGVLKS